MRRSLPRSLCFCLPGTLDGAAMRTVVKMRPPTRHLWLVLVAVQLRPGRPRPPPGALALLRCGAGDAGGEGGRGAHAHPVCGPRPTAPLPLAASTVVSLNGMWGAMVGKNQVKQA